MTANRDVPIAVAVSLASVAAFFAMGWTIAGLIYDRMHRR